MWELNPPGDSGAAVTVEIQPGWGAKEAGDALQAHGVIGSSLAFQIWAKVSGTNFQAGGYQLTRTSACARPRPSLRAGPGAALAPSRWRCRRGSRSTRSPTASERCRGTTATRSSRPRRRAWCARSCSPRATTSLEGLTWPDTYFIGEHETDDDILRTIVGRVRRARAAAGRHVVRHGEDRVPGAGRVDGGRRAATCPPSSPTVCQRGMPLQIDATLCYAKGGCPPVPNNADKQIDSPYNTYKVTGLPPTPIMTVTDVGARCRRAPGRRAVPLLRDRQGRRHPLRHDARRARAEHPRARGERRVTAPVTVP